MSASDPRTLSALSSAVKMGKLSKADLLSLANSAYGPEAKEDVLEKALADCLTFGQMSSKPPRYLIDGLFPEKALTALSAPSYNCKSWLALQAGHALSTGRDFLGFRGPGEKVPCIYHVPEMNEAWVRDYMAKIGFEDSPDFRVRPMEKALWRLDSPEMLATSKGRYIFLDTTGYFNNGDDIASYSQSVEFANSIYNLVQNGCLGACGLFHPPKYASDVDKKGNPLPWTLENSIIGSAGYGGILRSLLRMKNLNQYKEQKEQLEPWVYVLPLKNRDSRPFQLAGAPLRMLSPQGESPYMKDLTGMDPRKIKAFAMFEQGAKRDEILKELRISANTLAEWKKEWKASKEAPVDDQYDGQDGPEQEDMDFVGNVKENKQ